MDYSFTPVLVDQEECRDYRRSSCLEWLETDGTGSYAMGTVAGPNTRRFHGLLVASLTPPVQRKVFLAKVDEHLRRNDEQYDLGANQYPAAVYPRGFEHLHEFRLDPFPIWTWQVGADTITRKIFLAPGQRACVILYEAGCDCTLTVRPLMAFRDYHALTRASDEVNRNIERHAQFVSIPLHPSSMPPLILHHSGAEFEEDCLWFYNLEYQVDGERGMEDHEDLYSPGVLRFQIKGGEPAWIVAAIDPDQRYQLADIQRLEEEHRRTRAITGGAPFEVRLEAAANQFRAKRADGRDTIMAGFPWFSDWGRDTMISLPGLLIHQGLLDEAREVIEGFLYHLNQGLIPNHFPDVGAPHYNTCDATLWMFQAVWSYVENGGEIRWVRETFYPAVKSIIGWHMRGTLYDIHMDPEDSLLQAASDGVQLTWMDAKVGDWVVTPRQGKPVEVNALWYNALRMARIWAAEFGDTEYAHMLSALGDKVGESFAEKFWNAERNCLYDVLGKDGPDARVRPNQLFAVSLPFPLLDTVRQQAVVGICRDKLLTPFGLRTLAPDDPEYKAHYRGDRVERDSAYHQGTAWPWLLGPFVTAYLKAFGRTNENVAWCRELTAKLEPQMLVAGLGTLSEVYGGDQPHLPGGCIAQAWSVAEVLRLLRTELADAPLSQL
jgi:predicted glycogen debranching enzyme